MWTLYLEHDHDCSSPNEWGGWHVRSFDRNDCDYASHDLAENDLEQMLANKAAFMLDRLEHSGVVWSLHDEGMQCRWDTSRNAGYIYCEADDIPEDKRLESARLFLDEYNKWIAGRCYYFSLMTDDGEDVSDSCSGFIGEEYIVECLRGEHPELFYGNAIKDTVEVKGDAAWILEDMEIADTTMEEDPLGLDELDL